jgi:hypothetical protein
MTRKRRDISENEAYEWILSSINSTVKVDWVEDYLS